MSGSKVVTYVIMHFFLFLTASYNFESTVKSIILEIQVHIYVLQLLLTKMDMLKNDGMSKNSLLSITVCSHFLLFLLPY